jgi:hypothetical protein
MVPLLRLEIVKRSDDTKGFVVLPRRWVVLHPACPQVACQGVDRQLNKPLVCMARS